MKAIESPIVLALILALIGGALTAVNSLNPASPFKAPEISFPPSQLQSADGDTIGTKTVDRSYTLWGPEDDGCFFNVQTPFGLSGWIFSEPCPSGPDDEQGIAKFIQKLWEVIKSHSKDAPETHYQALVKLAKLYGVELLP